MATTSRIFTFGHDGKHIPVKMHDTSLPQGVGIEHLEAIHETQAFVGYE